MDFSVRFSWFYLPLAQWASAEVCLFTDEVRLLKKEFGHMFMNTFPAIVTGDENVCTNSVLNKGWFILYMYLSFSQQMRRHIFPNFKGEYIFGMFLKLWPFSSMPSIPFTFSCKSRSKPFYGTRRGGDGARENSLVSFWAWEVTCTRARGVSCRLLRGRQIFTPPPCG